MFAVMINDHILGIDFIYTCRRFSTEQDYFCISIHFWNTNAMFNSKRRYSKQTSIQIKLTVVARFFDHIYYVALLMKSRSNINGRHFSLSMLSVSVAFCYYYIRIELSENMCDAYVFGVCLVIAESATLILTIVEMHENKIYPMIVWSLVVVFSVVFTKGHQAAVKMLEGFE